MPTRPAPALAALALLAAVPAFAAAPARPAPQRPRLDVAFVLDTTGSMGDEIDVVKEKLVAIARRLSSGQPAPDVRFAVVAFRDQGDEYVTRSHAFDRDVKRVQDRIRALDANGGGDEPEDVAAALHATLALGWDAAPNVARVAFLVGDAAPQRHPGKPTWERAVTNLRERKITVHSIGCSGLHSAGLAAFKSIAESTKGDFETLTYRYVERLADGRSRTVLTAGGETFVADGELAEDEWKKGAGRLAAEGKVKREAVAAGPRGAGVGSLAVRAAAAPSAAAPMPSSSPAENNLDEEISAKLLDAAKSAGAEYAE